MRVDPSVVDHGVVEIAERVGDTGRKIVTFVPCVSSIVFASDGRGAARARSGRRLNVMRCGRQALDHGEAGLAGQGVAHGEQGLKGVALLTARRAHDRRRCDWSCSHSSGFA